MKLFKKSEKVPEKPTPWEKLIQKIKEGGD